MKLFGWALILVGGGLAVVGVRKLLAPPAEPGDPDYEDYPEWENPLTTVDREADPSDGV